MRSLIDESSASATHNDEFSAENKKKKRRSRKTKQNHSISACSSASELCVDESNLSKGHLSNYEESNGYHQHEKEYIASFSLMPTSQINDNMQNEQLQRINNVTVSNIRPEPAACIEPVGSVLKARSITFQACRKYFSPHWSSEVVSKALEKGQVFRALFRVNAYNRIEAYCKIDGLQSDVLISGAAAQNRAIEGDTVAIILDPPSLWPRMKGSVDTINNSPSQNNGLQHQEALIHVQDHSKGKTKLNPDYEDVSYSTHTDFLENGMCDEYVSSSRAGSNNSYTNKMLENGDSNGNFDDMYDSVNSLEKLCTLVNLLLSKRPTGRVVAITGRSVKRDKIVGFLSVKQWIYSQENRRKDYRKNKNQSDLNHGYVLLMPTGPKFTKMTVPVRNLPESIKKRLESGDLSVESEIVAAQIVDWPEESHIPEVSVIHTFGRGSDIEAQIAAILFENSIDSSEFSSDVLSCLPNTPWEISQEELKRRRDLRDLCVFTIDPATATDLDDALSVERIPGGIFRVGVHIADVSYFVLPDTALDIDAQIRSTSVYLLQRKLPMLPQMLSENFASLNPGVDRLAYSIIWDINCSGEVLDRWIGRTIIRSCSKLSYKHAQEIIEGSNEQDLISNMPPLHGRFEWREVIKSVKTLHEISLKLKESRFKGGALSLESPKVVFLFDEEGMPCDSTISGRIDSNFLVEELMLLANSTAAEVITRAYPSCALLRRHPEPNARKLREFKSFCKKHGLKLDVSSSTNLHQSLELIKRELVNDSILVDILMSYAARPMQLASYFCSGDSNDTNSERCHYALAVPLYTHFTSPLRRYPDIVVHRTLAATIEAEEIYLKRKSMAGKEVLCKGFTGICFDQDVMESVEAKEALSISASKHRVPCSEILVDVAAHCNEKKLATRHVKDATDKLCMWVLLKKKEILYSEARVLDLGPKFMSVYIPKLAIERRIYYDEVEGLTAEWLEATSTLVINQPTHKQPIRRSSPGKSKTLEEVALVINPVNLKMEEDLSEEIVQGPAVLPLTVHLLSTIPVVLHAVGGDDAALDIVARLYLSSYFH